MYELVNIIFERKVFLLPPPLFYITPYMCFLWSFSGYDGIWNPVGLKSGVIFGPKKRSVRRRRYIILYIFFAILDRFCGVQKKRISPVTHIIYICGLYKDTKILKREKITRDVIGCVSVLRKFMLSRDADYIMNPFETPDIFDFCLKNRWLFPRISNVFTRDGATHLGAKEDLFSIFLENCWNIFALYLLYCVILFLFREKYLAHISYNLL